MSSRLDALFEEDVQMQDAIEDISDMDDGNDVVLSVIYDRAKDSEKNDLHLFTNEDEPVNDDGLTDEEELEVQMALLNDNDDEDLDLDDEDLVDDL